MRIKGGILLTARDIQLITGIENVRSAQREHQTIRDSIGKKSKRLTIQEYCDYWEFDLEEIVNFLNTNR